MRWRFLDKVTSLDPWRAASGTKAISLEEYLLLDPFGRKGQFPETLILESCVELVRWLVERSSGFERTCILAEIERFSLRSGPFGQAQGRPEEDRMGGVGMGDVLTLRADVAQRDGESLAVVADVSCGERGVAEGKFVVCLIGLSEVRDAESAAAMWKELHGTS